MYLEERVPRTSFLPQATPHLHAFSSNCLAWHVQAHRICKGQLVHAQERVQRDRLSLHFFSLNWYFPDPRPQTSWCFQIYKLFWYGLNTKVVQLLGVFSSWISSLKHNLWKGLSEKPLYQKCRGSNKLFIISGTWDDSFSYSVFYSGNSNASWFFNTLVRAWESYTNTMLTFKNKNCNICSELVMKNL